MPCGAGNGAEPTVRQAPEERVFVDPEERLEAVVGVIRSARQRLLLSLFRCNYFKVLDELAAAV